MIEKNKEVKVFDNFFPDDLYEKLLNDVNFISYVCLRTDRNDDFYLTHHVFGEQYYSNPSELTDVFSERSFAEAWKHVKTFLNVTDFDLESSYVNGLKFGMEAHPHFDSTDDKLTTVICYLTPSWNIHWGGETCFYDKSFEVGNPKAFEVRNPAAEVFYEAEITDCIVPRQNRIVVFNGNTMHAVKPLSKSFKGIRVTLMFKVRKSSK